MCSTSCDPLKREGHVVSKGGALFKGYKFTGKERDAESGLDDFNARYYSSSMGRFMSPDWSAEPDPVPYANFYNPQTLNLYSYVRNNPHSNLDADGHDVDFKSPAIEEMFNRIADESDSFRSELDAAKADHNIIVVVQEVGVQTLPDHAPGDAVVTLNSDGTVKVVINVKRDDERTAEHEVGHEKDARTNTKQFFDDAKAKGGPGEKPHDQRPVEQRANKFRDQVERERKQHRQEEKERKRREKEERKKKANENQSS